MILSGLVLLVVGIGPFDIEDSAYSRVMGSLAIITGASSGLGLALARQVPFEGRVIDISRSGPPEDSGIEHIEADLSDMDVWPRVAATIARLVDEEDPGRSVFIHSAGTLTPIGFAGEVATHEYTRNVILNSASGQVLGHAYLSVVAGRGGTHDLVMISSGAASSTYPGWSAYGAGKAALDQWVRYVGVEQSIRGDVRVSAIAPGVIDTKMQAEIRETSEDAFPRVDRFKDLHQEGNLASPEDAAGRLWGAIEAGLKTGSVIDLRDYRPPPR